MTSKVVLKGARLLDPVEGLDQTADLEVVDGTITALGPAVSTDGAAVYDCSGAIVTPGLIDGHVHIYEDVGFNGIDPDVLGIGSAVTTVVDAGSAGAATFAGLRRYVMSRAKTNVLALLHVATNKMGMGAHEYSSVKAMDEDLIARIVEDNRDRIIGLKLRACEWHGDPADHPLRRAVRLGEKLKLPVMVHIGQRPADMDGEPASIRDVVKILRPGDIVTHLFTAYPGGLLDGNGRLQPDVREAYNAGLRFDLGHGLYNMSFDTAARVLDQGVEPHSVSTDGHKGARHHLVYDLPTTMAKMLHLGYTLPQLVRKTTYDIAESLGHPELVPGIAVGRPANLSVLRLEDVEWTAEDSTGKKVSTQQQLRPVMSVMGAEVHQAQPVDLQ
ncbi:MAG TPA: amidohydrolase/deacetylase family metallohydrolase [Chloroflexota bacterium]|nr:amidohydrolase/deacetylase family metallohydrolase [Chloroflexota bacterium]